MAEPDLSEVVAAQSEVVRVARDAVQAWLRAENRSDFDREMGDLQLSIVNLDTAFAHAVDRVCRMLG
jgi:hypothetical protein